jgi:nitrite reductase/ring-hydroxylating ferredoxin subunit
MNQPEQPTIELGVRNPWSWCCVAFSQDLQPGRNLPIVLHGERLVVWRSESGDVGAWSDRCPHRGMRLSFGAVYKDSLICAYHGWTFGPDGHCQKIPAHPGNEPSRAARVRIYPSIEADGYVWVCLGEPATTRPDPTETLRPIRSMQLAIDTQLATAAAFICVLDPENDENILVAPEAMKWTRQDGALAAETACEVDSVTPVNFSVSLSAAGRISCRSQRRGSPALQYQLLLQPSSEGRCVVHLSSNGPAIGVNRALVRFRRYTEAPNNQKRIRTTYENVVQASSARTSRYESGAV